MLLKVHFRVQNEHGRDGLVWVIGLTSSFNLWGNGGPGRNRVLLKTTQQVHVRAGARMGSTTLAQSCQTCTTRLLSRFWARGCIRIAMSGSTTLSKHLGSPQAKKVPPGSGLWGFPACSAVLPCQLTLQSKVFLKLERNYFLAPNPPTSSAKLSSIDFRFGGKQLLSRADNTNQ